MATEEATQTTKDAMLTTVDNPFSPFTQYGEWLEYDESHGYYSNALLARITVTSEDISEADQDLAIVDALNEIVRINASGIHVLAYA